jgi:hypothetical protein
VTIQEFARKLQEAIYNIPDEDGEPGFAAGVVSTEIVGDTVRMIVDIESCDVNLEVTTRKEGSITK